MTLQVVPVRQAEDKILMAALRERRVEAIKSAARLRIFGGN